MLTLTDNADWKRSMGDLLFRCFVM